MVNCKSSGKDMSDCYTSKVSSLVFNLPYSDYACLFVIAMLDLLCQDVGSCGKSSCD